MFPAVTSPAVAIKVTPPATAQTAPKTIQAPQQGAARTSAGEASAANQRTLSAQAVDAAEQTSVAPRLRDQETAERSERLSPKDDAPTGPPPSFDESPLERQARTALELPVTAPAIARDENETDDSLHGIADAPLVPMPPPSPTEQAETGFAATQALVEQSKPARLDRRK